jgi:DNA invertase Pin-like site-specific DNA recombinase
LVSQIEALSESATESDWVAVCQSYDGTLDLAEFGDYYRRSSKQTEEARQTLHAGIRQAAKTMSESEIARVSGVTRMTVRKALGK